MIRRERPELNLGDEELTAVQQTARDSKSFESSKQSDAMLQTLINSLDVQKRYGRDTSAEKETLRAALTDTAALRAAFLQMTIDDVSLLEAQVKPLPEEKELNDRLRGGNGPGGYDSFTRDALL